MNEKEKVIIIECIKILNNNLSLYYDFVPSVTAKGTIMMKGKPITIFECLQFTEGKMEITKEAVAKLHNLLRAEE